MSGTIGIMCTMFDKENNNQQISTFKNVEIVDMTNTECTIKYDTTSYYEPEFDISFLDVFVEINGTFYKDISLNKNTKTLTINNLINGNDYKISLYSIYKDTVCKSNSLNIKMDEFTLLPGRELNAKLKSLPEISNIKKINFLKYDNSLSIQPTDIDFSRSQNKKIIGRIEGSSLNIIAKQPYYANSSSSHMFSNTLSSNAFSITNVSLKGLSIKKVETLDDFFRDCSMLESIEFGDLNSPKLNDIHNMFYGCTLLKSINLTGLNTTNVLRMDDLFRGCSSITSINLSGFDTKNVTHMENMFLGCSSLIDLDISSFTTDNTTLIYEMFKDCTSLKSLDLSKWNTNAVTDASYFVSNCTSLTSLIFGKSENFNTSSITNMERAFANCNNLSGEITINGTACTNYKAIFEDCSTEPNSRFVVKYIDEPTKALATQMVATKTVGSNVVLYEEASLLDGPTFNTNIKAMPSFANVKTINFKYENPAAASTYENIDVSLNQDKSIVAYINGTELNVVSEREMQANPDMQDMFSNLTAITAINFNNFRTDNVTNMYHLFYKATELTTLDLSKWNTSKVQYMNSMFSNCTKLQNVNVSSFDTRNVIRTRYMFSECNALTSLNLSHFDTSKVTDMNQMFYNCCNLVSLNISNFNTSLVKNMSAMFSLCSKLASLDVSSFDTSLVTSMSFMFNKCSSLSELDVSHFNTSKVTTMQCMFDHCYNLTRLDVSNFDTSNVTNMEEMFYACSNLTSLNLSNFNTSLVTDMNTMFSKCSGLISLDVSNFNTANVTKMSFMFHDCSSLTALNVSSFNTSLVTQFNSMFSGCSNLTELNLSHFDTSKAIVMNHMFYSCSSLTALNVSSFNTSLVTTMKSIFNGCSKLTNLDISNFNTIKINDTSFMFKDCSKLTSGITLSCANTATHTDMFLNCSTDPNAKFTVKYENPTTKETALAMIATKSVDSNVVLFEPVSYVKLQNGTDFANSLNGIPNISRVNSISFNKGIPENINPENIDVSAAQNGSIIAYQAGYQLVVVSDENIFANEDCSYMFNKLKCGGSLVNISFDNFTTSIVTNTQSMFYGCNKLAASLTISNQNVSNYTDMFKYCSNNESTGKGFTVNFMPGCKTIAQNMVNTKSASSNVKLGIEIGESIIQPTNPKLVPGTTFNQKIKSLQGINTVKTINFKKGSLSDIATYPTIDVSEAKDNSIRAYINTQTSELNIVSDSTIQINESSEGLFKDMDQVSTINLTNFNTDLATTLYGLFYNCTALSRITIPNQLNCEKVTSLEYMFTNCGRLSEIDLTNFKFSNSLTNTSYMFYGCSQAASVNISTLNTSNVTNMNSMFTSCLSLTQLDLTNLDTSSVTSMNQMFYGCSNLITTITIKNNTTSYDGMFMYCSERSGLVTVKYDPEMKTVASNMVNTKTVGCNVVLYEEPIIQTTYGIYVNEEERNPSSGFNYINDSATFTKANKTDLGSWKDKWPYKDIRVVGFKNGSVTKEINKSNCKQYIDGSIVPADVDVMVEIPKFYWKSNSFGTGYEIRISNVKQEGFDCYAHKVNGVEKDFIYVGRYLGYVENGKLRSKSGVAPTTNNTLPACREFAHNVGAGYQQMNWYTLTAIRILYLLAYGNRDSQYGFGEGVVKTTKTNTGGTDTKGFMYGTLSNYAEQVSLFGIEDAWGNLLQWVDGIYCNANKELLVTNNNVNFNDTGVGFENLGVTPIISGWLTKVSHNNKSLFFPTAAGGSMYSYYSDWCNVQSGKFGTCGGFYNDGESPGMFLFNMDSTPYRADYNLGSRLVYLG